MPKPINKKDNWATPSVSGLEADIAYFDARLAMLEKEPVTSYQKAQIQTYRALESALIGTLIRLRHQPAGKSGKEGGMLEKKEEEEE